MVSATTCVSHLRYVEISSKTATATEVCVKHSAVQRVREIDKVAAIATLSMWLPRRQLEETATCSSAHLQGADNIVACKASSHVMEKRQETASLTVLVL